LIQFSIVTVVRNDLEGLKKSRASLDAQIYKKWQHIIIDCASTDGTLEFIKTLPTNNTKFISEPDLGIYNAMNKAWKISESDSFLYYLNARDIFASSESLFCAATALDCEPKSSWGCTTHEEIQINGEGWVCKLVSPPSIANQLYAFGYRSHQAILMKASFIRLLGGFDEKYQLAADWDLIVKALLLEPPTIWEDSLGRFELGGVSSQRLLEAHEELDLLRKVYLPTSMRQRFVNQIWCAIYLRDLGYQNYLSKIFNVLYPTHKKNLQNKKHLIFGFQSIKRFNSNKFTIIGKLLTIFFNSRLSIIRHFRVIQIKLLHKILKINPYSQKIS
jgi:glycosyltransferase involved in cell wall biosynthesis